MSPPSLRSVQRRKQSPEADALRMGCGWRSKDTDQPWILVESTHGDSHPGSVHLGKLADQVEKGVIASGGAPARYTCTDICDGIAQGTDGMDYSLPSREIMVSACEMHANAGHFDGAVFLAGCDKSLPAHLIAQARLNLPSVVVPGGVMISGPEGFTLEGIGTAYAQQARGEVDDETFKFLQNAACPSSGSCAFFGTAATMQLLSEVLGVALPATGLVPAHLNAHQQMARSAGEHVFKLIESDLRPADILTQKALDNALIVHAATGGSTNALLHLSALARELDLTFDYATIDRINRDTPFILNLKPSGKFTSDKIWYAGGVPRILWELKDRLHLDVMTVTGKTLGENLEYLEKAGHFVRMPLWLQDYGGTVEDIIRPLSNPLRPTGAVRILTGNLAPEGGVVKVSAVAESVKQFQGKARVFNNQHDCLDAIFKGKIGPGDAVIIRYEGPAASGMPEQFYVTEAIASNPLLATSTVLITDGRFSGASRGPAIGHISPEAAHGGPIALAEEGDLIAVDLDLGQLDIIGIQGEPKSAEEVHETLRHRREHWTAPPPKYGRGFLGWYTRYCLSAREGGGLSAF